jgi:hypothetical protein
MPAVLPIRHGAGLTSPMAGTWRAPGWGDPRYPRRADDCLVPGFENYRDAVVNGSSATCLARLIAVVNERWCVAHVPSLRRGSILPRSEM